MRLLVMVVFGLAGAQASASDDLLSHVDMCDTVEVVDPSGLPIANARVTWRDDDAPEWLPRIPKDWWFREADARGRLFAGAPGPLLDENTTFSPGTFFVEAPSHLGGRCAGRTQKHWAGRSAGCPIRVVVRVRPIAWSDLLGRVVDDSGHGIEGAAIRLLGARLNSARGEDCSLEPKGEATSTEDGAFVLRSVPNGKLTVAVTHPRYAAREVELTAPGPAQNVSLDAGATWKGHVLRPDGSVVERCEMKLALGRPPTMIDGSCSPAGFVLDHLPAGQGHLVVDIRGDRQLGTRVLEDEVFIQSKEHRERDVRWPSGELIAGRVVTPGALPVPDVVICAKPISAVPTTRREGVCDTSDPEGGFVFRHLMPSRRWAVFVAEDAYEVRPTRVRTGTTDLVLTALPLRDGRSKR